MTRSSVLLICSLSSISIRTTFNYLTLTFAFTVTAYAFLFLFFLHKEDSLAYDKNTKICCLIYTCVPIYKMKRSDKTI